MRSTVEEGAVARATTDRLRTELDRTWQRAVSAKEHRDALLAQRQRLVQAGRRARAQAGIRRSGQGVPEDRVETPEWVVASLKAGLFKAMAHPARVRVLEVLAAGRCSVGRLAEILDMEISHLSHQLAVLRSAALVDSNREGSVVFYSLRQPEWSQLMEFVAGEILTARAANVTEPTGPRAT